MNSCYWRQCAHQSCKSKTKAKERLHKYDNKSQILLLDFTSKRPYFLNLIVISINLGHKNGPITPPNFNHKFKKVLLIDSFLSLITILQVLQKKSQKELP